MAMVAALAQATLFRGIPLQALSLLVSLSEQRTFRAGSPLMRQGDASDCLYLILTGRVRVERSLSPAPEPLLLAELGPGEVVGEMGVLDGAPRSASVIAMEDTETLELSAAVLTPVILKFPEVSVALLRALSRRLRSTDELTEQLLRQLLARP